MKKIFFILSVLIFISSCKPKLSNKNELSEAHTQEKGYNLGHFFVNFDPDTPPFINMDSVH
jgi:hypothetical protein